MSETAKAQPKFATALTNVNETFMPLIMAQMQNNDIQMTPYAKQCTLHAISAIHAVLDKEGISWNSGELDKSTISDVLVKVACFQLNAAANPREIYFQLRNFKSKKGEKRKQIEMGIEGDGNDALLARFGRNVADINQIWKVREEDGFVYPTFNGTNMTPPQWTPKGRGKIIRVVYPIVMNHSDGKQYVEFFIAEREDVLKNLIAHISNTMMNETFGIAKSRWDATVAQKAEIDQKKKVILKKANGLGLDATLDDEELQQYISPAWTEYHSREAMIERKMRNNAIKKIPKDFANGAMETMFEEATNDNYRIVQGEVQENQASLPMEIEPEQDAPPEPPSEEPDSAQEQPLSESPLEQETTDEPGPMPGF